MTNPSSENRAPENRASENSRFEITTDAINDDGFFDPRYTCDFDNSSPELRWDNPPADTRGFALITEDPDTSHGGIYTHWLIYNIPSAIRHLPAGIPAQDTLPNGIRQGLNSAGKLGYLGPCPPLGDRAHRYFFRLFALREIPELTSRTDRETFLKVITPFILESVEIFGRYQRQRQTLLQKPQKRAG